jgi:hypothetical protein
MGSWALSSSTRDLLLAEGGTDFNGDVARGIQQGATALRTGLQATGTTSNLAEATGAWRYGKRFALPTSRHPGGYDGQRSNKELQ